MPWPDHLPVTRVRVARPTDRLDPVDRTVARLRERGHEPVEPENPYWERYGVTYEDPDGWRVVLAVSSSTEDPVE